ncbi:hypothetical protein TSST111916_12000 [Tsukamurella strandjordii]
MLCLVLLSVFPTTVANAGPGDVCPGVEAAMRSLGDRIAAHNAAPHQFLLPDQMAQYNAYNAEKAQLDTEQAALKSRVIACTEATASVAKTVPGGAPVETRAPDAIRDKLDAGKRAIPPNWQTPPISRKPSGKPEVPKTSPLRSIYDSLRGASPKKPKEFGNVILQNEPKPKIGDPNPAYPGQTIGRNRSGLPAVSPDHIVSLAELVQLNNFWRLTPDQMYLLSTTPINFQWLPTGPNQSKQSGSAASVNPPPDPGWIRAQVALEDRVRAALQDAIDKLVIANG